MTWKGTVRTLIADWRLEPIVVPRWALVVMYTGFIVLGIMSALAGIPTLDLTTPAGYVTPYAIAIVLSAAVAVWGAAAGDKHERVEMIGALLVFCLMTAYAGGGLALAVNGDIKRATFAVILLMITLPPAGRGIGLMAAAIRAWSIRRAAARAARAARG